MEMENVSALVGELVTRFGLRIIAAIAIFIIGTWLAKVIRRIVKNVLSKSRVDPTLIGFAGNLAYIAVLTFVTIAALAQLGIQTASFIAVLGAAGLAVGLALQGSLSNFAAGVLMLIFRPFKVGDFIEAAGAKGVVNEIQIFTTTLKTPDNKTVIIPNGKLYGDNIINYSTESQRRVDLTFGIGYEDNVDQARQIILDVLEQDQRIFKEPAPIVGVIELGESSVNFAVWSWVNASDYLNVLFDLNETIKRRFDEAGINIPYPQREVHFFQKGQP